MSFKGESFMLPFSARLSNNDEMPLSPSVVELAGIKETESQSAVGNDETPPFAAGRPNVDCADTIPTTPTS